MYENHKYLCIASLCISIFCYLLSPTIRIEVPIQEVSAQEAMTASGKTKTGVSMEIQTWTKENWNEKVEWWIPENKWVKSKTRICNADCKTKELISRGIRDEIAESLVINCKALAENPVMCIKIGASIVKNESGGGYKCKKANKYNCFWLNVKQPYTSFNDWVLHFIGKYNKYWYKAKNMAFFYSPSGKLPPSRFCTSEDSSNTSIGCPNWLKISSWFFNSLPF